MSRLYFNILFALCMGLVVQAQTTTKPVEKKAPLFADWRVELDVSPLVNTFLYKGERYAFEGSVQTLVRNKFFVVGELGFGGSEKLNFDSARSTSGGMFGRVGIDLNLMKPKPDSNPSRNYFLAGMRLGVSGYQHQLSNVLISDDYWDEARLYNYPEKFETNFWFEVLASTRVEIAKNVYMGWTVKIKNMMLQPKDGVLRAWYVPGYGLSGQTVWSVNYSVGYRF